MDNASCSSDSAFKRVRLLKPRHKLWRLDLAPFALLYVWALSRFVLNSDRCEAPWPVISHQYLTRRPLVCISE